MNLRTTRHMLAALALAVPALANAALPIVDVYKRASCGCCKEWIKHLEVNGFKVRAHDVADPGLVRQQGGIDEQFGSCHTAKVGKYTVEGHVPAAEIKRLIKANSNATGLAVPGMPMGSPGMEGPRRDAYDVLLVKQGKTSVYKHYD